MVYHKPDQFLTELTQLLKKLSAAQLGSVFITYKRYTPHADAQVRELQASTKRQAGTAKGKAHQQKKQTAADATSSSSSSTSAKPTHLKAEDLHPIHHVSPSDEPVCLIHARNGKHKLSTTVRQTEVKGFVRSLSAIMTVHNKLLEAGERKPGKHVPKRKLKESAPTAAADTTKGSAADASKTDQSAAPTTQKSAKKAKP